MAPTNKILSHRDYDEITRWLLDGISVREVAKRLRKRYPRKSEAHLRLASSTIQNFRMNHLKLDQKVVSDINEVNKLQRDLTKKKAIQDKVEQTDAYKEKINQIAEEKLDIQREMIKSFTIIESRLEHLYNQVVANEFIDSKEEKLLQGYLEQSMKLFEQYKKYIDGHKETTEHNINVNIVNDQVNVLRDAIREVLVDMDPDVSVRFMESMSNKMKELVYRADGQHVGVVNSRLING